MDEARAITGFENLYEVDREGNVYSLIQGQGRRKRKLKPFSVGGYLKVNLYSMDGKHFKKYVHRLVAETFIPNPDNLGEVNHIDCNKSNNRVENLEWCSRNGNLQHSYMHGRKRQGETHGCHKLKLCQVEEIRKRCLPQKAYAEKFNVSQSTISAIQRGRLWKEGGFNG